MRRSMVWFFNQAKFTTDLSAVYDYATNGAELKKNIREILVEKPWFSNER